MTRFSTIGVVVSCKRGSRLPSYKDGDKVEICVNIHDSRIIKLQAIVEATKPASARLRFVSPRSSDIRALSQWFNTKRTKATLPSKRSMGDRLKSITLKQLTNLLDRFLKSIQGDMLQMAHIANNNAHETQLFDTIRIFNEHGNDINQRCCQALTTTPALLTGTPSAENQHHTVQAPYKELELMDQKQFEHKLFLETIIKRANTCYRLPLYCLQQRYNQLFNTDLRIDQLPMSVDRVCHALEHALTYYSIEENLLPDIYRVFDETVVSKLGELYQTLNESFIQLGILPRLESQPLLNNKTTASGSEQPQASLQKQANTGNDTEHSEATPQARLMNTVRQCQDLMRVTGGQNNSESKVDANNILSIDELVNELTSIQHNASSMEEMLEAQSLRQTLGRHNNKQMSQATTDLVGLVESVFTTLDSYTQLSKALLSIVKRLQVPITKAALIDPDFFASQSHPAKVLLNRMIDISLNSEIPNIPLEHHFETLIKDIIKNYDRDNGVFERANQQLAITAEQQAKTYSRNTKRIIQTYEGRQQLKQASGKVDEVINQRIKPPRAPKVLVELVDNGWRELLKLTYLKYGPDSEPWRNNVDVIDQLSKWLSRIAKQPALKKTSKRRSKANAIADFVERKLNAIFPGDYRYRTTIDKIRDIQKGTGTIEYVDIEPIPQQFDGLAQRIKASKPELSRWFRLAEQVNIGDEFAYLNDNSGKKNITLVWISNDKQHFVFVNNRGQKVLDFDLFSLANEFSQGMIPVEKKSELPVVERSLYSTIQHAYETLAFKSTHDELTGVHSRKECERLLTSAINEVKKNTHIHYCLLYVDIDQFSLINDLHGHVAGDHQLIEIAKLIKTQLPQNTTVARMAGNEFVILLKGLDQQQHLKIAEDLRNSVEQHHFKWQDNELRLTISIGLVEVNEYTKNVIELVRNAIEACQTAKHHGGNRFYGFSQESELHTRREKLLAWIDKLDHVLSSDQLVLRAQAIAPTLGGSEEPHYEILIALKDKNGRLYSPTEFIEAAENYSRMQKVDRWVIDRTFRWLQKLSSSPCKVPSISINLSGNSLNDDSFSSFLLSQFETYRIPTSKICFEVTETATINNIAAVADFIREIKKMGCKFSLDDFGSGNASYQYLRHLPVDYIKIDGMFVQEIDRNPNDFALVKSIHEIAHLMGKKTVAEYAESEPIIDKLKEIGVDYIQGYAIGMPTVLSDINMPKKLP